jgi:transposase InsO family protein
MVSPKEFLTSQEFIKFSKIPERTFRRRIKEGKFISTKEGNKLLFHYTQLPDDKAREAFLQDRGLAEAKAEPKIPANLKPWQRDTMLKREDLVKNYLAAEGDIPRGGKAQFQGLCAREHGISAQTLRRWTKDYKQSGRQALIPLWTPGNSERVITKAMEKFIGVEYMRPFGPPIKEVHEKLCIAFSGHHLPTYRTIVDYIDRTWPKSQQLLVRDKEAWDRIYSPHVKRDWGAVKVNEVWVGDAKQIDVACHYKGKPIFPWFTAFLDAASRKFVGWILTPTPNAAAIAQAFAYSAQEHGIPRVVYIDRGKAYKSRQITGERIKETEITPLKDFEGRIVGIFGEMGTEVFWAAPYNAREKIIEPAFKIFTYRLRGLPGYRGHNTKTRPKKLAYEIRSGKLLPFEELSKKINEVVSARNARPHSTTGKIPNSYYDGITPAIPSKNLLAFLNMDVRKGRVGASAVTIDGLTYRHEDLFKLAGEEVEIRRDPRDIRQAAIIYKDTFYCIASEVQVAHYQSPLTLENVKEAKKIRRKARQYRAEIIKQGGHIEDPLRLAVYLNEKEREVEVTPRALGGKKVVSLHKKERLAKKVAEGLKESPQEAGERDRGGVVKMPKEDSLEDKIKRGLFGI